MGEVHLFDTTVAQTQIACNLFFSLFFFFIFIVLCTCVCMSTPSTQTINAMCNNENEARMMQVVTATILPYRLQQCPPI